MQQLHNDSRRITAEDAVLCAGAGLYLKAGLDDLQRFLPTQDIDCLTLLILTLHPFTCSCLKSDTWFIILTTVFIPTVRAVPGRLDILYFQISRRPLCNSKGRYREMEGASVNHVPPAPQRLLAGIPAQLCTNAGSPF